MITDRLFYAIAFSSAWLAEAFAATKRAFFEAFEHIFDTAAYTDDRLYAELVEETGGPYAHTAADDAFHTLAGQKLRDHARLMTGVRDGPAV